MDNVGLVAYVRAAQAGSLHDFEVLVQQFQDMAMGYSRVLLNDTHLAEDAAQDACVQAYTRLEQLQTPEAFPGWFRQIVYSCCMRYRQRRNDPAQYILDRPMAHEPGTVFNYSGGVIALALGQSRRHAKNLAQDCNCVRCPSRP